MSKQWQLAETTAKSLDLFAHRDFKNQRASGTESTMMVANFRTLAEVSMTVGTVIGMVPAFAALIIPASASPITTQSSGVRFNDSAARTYTDATDRTARLGCNRTTLG